jgi:hypothetical protein
MQMKPEQEFGTCAGEFTATAREEAMAGIWDPRHGVR